MVALLLLHLFSLSIKIQLKKEDKTTLSLAQFYGVFIGGKHVDTFEKTSSTLLPQVKKELYSLSSELFILLDGKGRIKDIYPGFLNIFIPSKNHCAAFLEKSIFEIPLFKEFKSKLQLSQKTRHSFSSSFFLNSFESKLLCEDKQPLPVFVKVIDLFDELKKPYFLIIIKIKHLQDEIEEELSFLAEEYEKLMRRYREAQQEYLILREMKTNFMSLTSHELFTPLQIIMGNLELLKTEKLGKLNPKQMEKLEVAIRNSTRIYDMTREMYDLNQPNIGPFSLNKKPVSLLSFLREVISDFEVLFQQKGLKVHINFPESLPEILLDKDKFWQSCSKIFEYLLRYSKEKEEIYISAQEKGEYIKITIRKSGKSIEKKHRKFLFECFYEPFDIMNHKEGTALELPLAKKYIEAHGGELRAEIDEEKGIMLILLLPLRVPLEKSIEWKTLKAEKMAGFVLNTKEDFNIVSGGDKKIYRIF